MKSPSAIAGRRSLAFGILLSAAAIATAPSTSAALTITPTFTSAFLTNFGVAGENAWIAAANVFQTNFSDNIHINITVDGTAGTSPFGSSLTSLVGVSYGTLRSAVIADAKTTDDFTSIGPGGSIATTDPSTGNGTWVVSRAQAKALGLLPDNAVVSDGTTTFGGGNPWTFSGAIAPGTFDFQGVAAHEISEVMGRRGLVSRSDVGALGLYELPDLFTFSAPGNRGSFNTDCSSSSNSDNNFFSIDNGTTLLMRKNQYCRNGLDTEDWASGSNDAFNQFSSSNVVNPVTAVDLREMDVYGYDRTSVVITPEPGTLMLVGTGLALLAGGWLRRRRKNEG